VKLYTAALSPFSAKIRIALDEKGLRYEEISLPSRRSGIVEKPPELLEINPRGEVPTLVDGAVRLFDSTVILEYLEDAHPEPPLLPRTPAERARARLVEELADWMLGSCVADLLAETFSKPDAATRDPGRLAEAEAAVRRAHARLERELDAGARFCREFSAADLACYLPVAFAAFYGVAPGPEQPRLAAWLARTAERPSVARERARMTEALAKLED
jgi:glutathione S-transferase